MQGGSEGNGTGVSGGHVIWRSREHGTEGGGLMRQNPGGLEGILQAASLASMILRGSGGYTTGGSGGYGTRGPEGIGGLEGTVLDGQ